MCLMSVTGRVAEGYLESAPGTEGKDKAVRLNLRTIVMEMQGWMLGNVPQSISSHIHDIRSQPGF